MIRGPFVAAVVASSLAFAGLAVTSEPAHAVTTVNVSVNQNKLTLKYGQCKKISVTATGDWASDANGNFIDITIWQHGHYIDGDLVEDERTGGVNMRFKVCGDDVKSGKVNVVLEVSGYAGPPTYAITEATARDTFKAKVKPRKGSHLSVHKKRVNDGAFKWQVVAQLKGAGKPYANQRVYLEADIVGWTVMDSAKTTKQGLVGWRFKPTGVRWRFTYAGNSLTKPSISAAFYAGQPRVAANRVDPRSLRGQVKVS